MQRVLLLARGSWGETSAEKPAALAGVWHLLERNNFRQEPMF